MAGPKEALVAELRAHALVLGDVVLSSGRTASYYVDAKRAILRPAGFRALGALLAEQVAATGALAVGGLTMGADAPACAAAAAPSRSASPGTAATSRPTSRARCSR